MIPREWIISHRCSWMAVYVFCCNAQSESHSDPHDICMISLFYQLPNYNLFTQHVVIYLMERDHSWTADLGPISFTLLSPVYFTHTVYFLAYYYCFPLDMLIPLFTANWWDWQPHRKLGAKFLVVLCAGFMLLLGEDTPAIFLAPLPGRKKISARGVSHSQSFTLFLFCFILLLLASFYQKYKKISSFDSLHPLLLPLVHYVVP